MEATKEIETPTLHNNGRKTGVTARELLNNDYPEPVWIVPEMLPVGLSILAGKPKIGKSWLSLQLAISVGTGGNWLDKKVDKHKVLYYALEDSERRIKDRAIKLGMPPEADIQFEFGLMQALNTPAGIESFGNKIKSVKPSLVIVDTMARSFNAKIDWRKASEVTEGLSKLQQAALRSNICILFIDHHKKPNGSDRDVIMDLIDSVSKPGVADTIMGIYRGSGKREWTLQLTGRDVEETELAIYFDKLTGCWQCLGNADEIRADSNKARIMEAINALGSNACQKAISAYTGIDKGNISRLVGDLIADGYLKEIPDGRKKVLVPIPLL